MKQLTLKTSLIAYLLIAILTFGHSASNSDQQCPEWQREGACIELDALGAATLWPLYWSWTLQE